MWVEATSAADWDAALCRLPSPHVLQSWAWGAFKSRWGWRAERWLMVDENDQPCAAAQLLTRAIGRLPVCVMYAPKGPVALDLAAYEAALAHIEQRAGQQRAVWAKVDGDLLLPSPSGRNVPVGRGDGGEGELEDLRNRFIARRWRLSPSQIQFRNTGLSDLRHTDDLLAGMKPKTRYNIRLAEKRGVTVRVASPIDSEDAALFYAMYADTSKRDGFLIRDAAYYVDAWRAMNATGFVAEREGEPLAGIVLFVFAGRAWYFYGMSRNAGREHMPNHLLQWTAMRWARDHGCASYDWWGAPEREDDEHDAMAGVWRFKQGFGAQFVEGIGAWDYAPIPVLYGAYRKLGARLIRSGLAG